MTKDEVLKLALEALEKIARLTGPRWALENSYAGHLEAIIAIKAALAQPEQEPTGMLDIERLDKWLNASLKGRQKRKPLTDEQIETIWRRVQANDFHDCVQPFARAIEAAHGIKE